MGRMRRRRLPRINRQRSERVSRGHVPVRTCVVCGRKHPRSVLLRLALDREERHVVYDRRRCMPGRGAYVCRECLPRLRLDRRLRKAFRNEVKGITKDIIESASGN